MGSDVGQIFPTASLHRDHSILYALVCEKKIFLHTGSGYLRFYRGIENLLSLNDSNICAVM